MNTDDQTKQRPKVSMDSRCPRGLEHLPDSFCPLAVMRLKAIRNAGRELSEEEENSLNGCPWAVNHQLAHYCFFSYMHDYSGDKPPSDIEIASLNCISVDTVKKIEKTAIAKMKASKDFTEMREAYGDEAIVPDSNIDDYSIIK